MRRPKTLYFKYAIFLIAIFGMTLLSGCRIFRHKHQTKYGARPAGYKKNITIDKKNLAEVKSIY
jgi:hypothetical protein